MTKSKLYVEMKLNGERRDGELEFVPRGLDIYSAAWGQSSDGNRGARHGKAWGGSHDNPRGSLNTVYKGVVERTIAPCPRIPSPWICCLLWVYALSS